MKRTTVALLLLLGACKVQETDTVVEDDRARILKIGLVLDVGQNEETGLGASALRGLKRAENELSINIEHAIPKTKEERAVLVGEMGHRKLDLVIGMGAAFTEDLIVAAKAYPTVTFAGIDLLPLDKTPRNLIKVQFRDEQSGFLVGAVAGLSSKTRRVGFVGGMKAPGFERAEVGYRAGVRHVANDVEMIINYAGYTLQAFSDPTTGKKRALEQFEQKVDVIFHAAGATGLGVINAAAEQDKLAIGMIVDQHDEAPKNVLTSALRHYDAAVFETIRAKKGETLKEVLLLGLEQNAVGVAYSEKNAKLLPETVYRQVMSLRERIVEGTLVVPETRSTPKK